jgi:F-type H+-transporting ATPase subunit b
MTFDWWTFALQALNFAVLVWLLRRFLLKPLAAMVARRKEEIGRGLTEAEAAKQAAEQARRSFEERLSQTQAEREKLLADERARTAEERRKILEQAQAEAERLKSETLKRLAEESEAAIERAFDRSVQIAVELAGRLLGDASAASLEQPFLDRVVAHLDGLSNANPAVLRSRLFDRNAATVQVTTAHSLDSADEAQWRAALTQRVGSAEISFSSDASLIAGVCIRFPLATLNFNWRDSLAAARKQMIRDEPGR